MAEGDIGGKNTSEIKPRVPSDQLPQILIKNLETRGFSDAEVESVRQIRANLVSTYIAPSSGVEFTAYPSMLPALQRVDFDIETLNVMGRLARMEMRKEERSPGNVLLSTISKRLPAYREFVERTKSAR